MASKMGMGVFYENTGVNIDAHIERGTVRFGRYSVFELSHSLIVLKKLEASSLTLCTIWIGHQKVLGRYSVFEFPHNKLID